MSISCNLNKLNDKYNKDNINKFIFILNSNNKLEKLSNNIIIKSQYHAFIMDENFKKFESIPFQVKNIGSISNLQLKYSNQTKFIGFNKR